MNYNRPCDNSILAYKKLPSWIKTRLESKYPQAIYYGNDILGWGHLSYSDSENIELEGSIRMPTELMSYIPLLQELINYKIDANAEDMLTSLLPLPSWPSLELSTELNNGIYNFSLLTENGKIYSSGSSKLHAIIELILSAHKYYFDINCPTIVSMKHISDMFLDRHGMPSISFESPRKAKNVIAIFENFIETPRDDYMYLAEIGSYGDFKTKEKYYCSIKTAEGTLQVYSNYGETETATPWISGSTFFGSQSGIAGSFGNISMGTSIASSFRPSQTTYSVFSDITSHMKSKIHVKLKNKQDK